MDGAAGPEQDHLPEAAFRHEGGEPGLPFIEVAAKVHALFPGGEEAITRIEAYAPGVKAAVLQMLLQMTEERPYWSLQQQHARAGSRWQRGRAPLLSWVMSVRIRALLHILLNRAVHVAVFELACRTWGPSIKRSEEHTSELLSLMLISYAVFFLQKNT